MQPYLLKKATNRAPLHDSAKNSLEWKYFVQLNESFGALTLEGKPTKT